MLATIQNKVSRETAETFIRQMEQQGFTAVNKRDHVHFVYQDRVDINHSVYLDPNDDTACFIGVRPVADVYTELKHAETKLLILEGLGLIETGAHASARGKIIRMMLVQNVEYFKTTDREYNLINNLIEALK